MRILLLLLLVPFAVFAQDSNQKRVDSLEKELKFVEADTSKVNIMNNLINAYDGIDSLKLFKIGAESIKKSKEIDYLKGLADAYIELGGAYRSYSLDEEAQEYLEKGNKLAEKLVNKDSSEINLKTWMKGHYYLALTYGNKGLFEKEAVENRSPGMGLSNLRTRVAYLKGDLDFQSQENEGTTVNVHLTVDHDHAA